MRMNKKALIGLDGFIDEVVHVVDQRISDTEYSRIETIKEYGNRLIEGSGLSTNVEIVTVGQKLGGNGPIYANGLKRLGCEITYIGCVGKNAIHPVFEELSEGSGMIGVEEPGFTEAMEFMDGKIIRSKTTSLNRLCWNDLVEKMGTEELTAAFQESDLISFNNWTMIFHMNEIWEHLLKEIVPKIHDLQDKLLFFDLADPRKRTGIDLLHALNLIEEFQKKGFCVQLGLNLKEAVAIAGLLDDTTYDVQKIGLKELLEKLAGKIRIDTIVVHPVDRAACISGGEYEEVKGPYCSRPKLTTGAGDIFNSGFVAGQLTGKTKKESLEMGVSASGYYVRNGRSADSEELQKFMENWKEGSLED